ncbi:MAG: bifunctional (p)ppGpp synthetase/guanosine-3',5'-bis(diphosphate) 3'-pyrophosphohydrolase [Alphaproteobacteria bacterium]|nr:bifunctional (p)ppGpp synthetase/guanosine-3',5'-bis(diphosphate) 3'-pyrophosphohydrolase [Alphaproteobacteria bacterium]
MIRQFELVERVKAYDPSADEDAINRAYVYAMKMHGAQKRASGDPYFSHPIEVAGILTQFHLDGASIITALLHDVIEDTTSTLEEIQKIFGADIARLVDGVTKLTRLELTSDQANKQAENFRKLVLAMSEDIRVLLVKLADRLHNMRTLHYIENPDKRKRIAMETMEIYAPLAERIGMQEIKNELEDLAFGELHTDVRQSITNRLDFLKQSGGNLIGHILAELDDVMKGNKLVAEISGREKTPYSIWRKMQRKDVGFEQLSDIMAFRIIVDNVDGCYRALGVLHSHYPVVPGRFKDYISLPKPNGYKSLHTGVLGPEHQRIEVQIRTRDMHEVAELGVAAHWNYKDGGPNTDGRQYRWLRELLDILDHASGPEEFLEHTRLEMFQDQVFCFSPKGDLIALPRGACPVDFAYAVHSQVGDTCVGAKVNGRMVPLKAALVNGDQVEILTSKAQSPQPAWERFVVTGKARACIRRFIRNQQRSQFLALGREILSKAFRQEGYELTNKALDGVIKQFKAASADDLIVEVGEGHHTGREVLLAVYPGLKEHHHAPNVVPLPKQKDKTKQSGKHEHAVPIKGLIPGMAMHFAGCCHPLPGDRIVGIITTGRGVTIHTIDCDMLSNLQDQPERWLDIAWDAGAEIKSHTSRISMVVANEQGSLGTLATVIAKNKGNITNVKITNRSTDFFELMVDVEVHDVRHLTNIIAALRATPEISSVDRARS